MPFSLSGNYGAASRHRMAPAPHGSYSRGAHSHDGHLVQIYAPSGFPKFDSKPEAVEYEKVLRCRQSNPDFPHLRQVVTTLVTWKQVERYVLQPLLQSDALPRRRTAGISERWRASNVFANARTIMRRGPAISPNPKEAKSTGDATNGAAGAHTLVHGIESRLALPFHRVLSTTAVVHTMRYLFFHMKCGIYVRIADNRLAMFAPFANRDYVNVWSQHLTVDRTKYKSRAEYFADKQRFLKRRENILADEKAWWCNASVICNEHNDQVWGDTHLPQLIDMLREVCATRDVADCDFFLNRRDHAQLKQNLTEPYDNVMPQRDCPLSREKHESYAPICSFFGGPRYADIMIPHADDWEVATGKVFVGGNDLYSALNRARGLVEWDKRIATCVFRGTATGVGTTVSSNPRICAAYMSMLWSLDPRYNEQNPIDGVPFLDAGLTSWNLRDKKNTGEPMTFLNPETLVPLTLTDFLPLHQQMRYKYILYVPGHSASARYSYLLSMGSLIFKVEAPESMAAPECWFFPLLQPWVDHVPVKGDLSDLAERIAWAKQHDAECRRIAAQARQLYDQYVCRSAILDYWQLTINSMAAQFRTSAHPSMAPANKTDDEVARVTRRPPVVPRM